MTIERPMFPPRAQKNCAEREQFFSPTDLAGENPSNCEAFYTRSDSVEISSEAEQVLGCSSMSPPKTGSSREPVLETPYRSPGAFSGGARTERPEEFQSPRSFDMHLIENNAVPIARRRRLKRSSPAVVRRRLEIVADALRLPRYEIDRAMADDDVLVDFSIRYNQSLDWIVLGDLRGMICSRCTEPPRDPPSLLLVHFSR